MTFVATTDDWRSLEIDGEDALEAERAAHRRTRRARAARRPQGFCGTACARGRPVLVIPGSRLEEALRAGAAGSEVRTVIAGYHWFGDWGRDTMISLEGLTLATGRLREAAAILRTF